MEFMNFSKLFAGKNAFISANEPSIKKLPTSN